MLQLTTGTTKPPSGTEPISGNPGTVTLNPAQNIVTVAGASLVDNTFAVPGVTACGGMLSPLLDEAVDLSRPALPASPGTSKAVLERGARGDQRQGRQEGESDLAPPRAQDLICAGPGLGSDDLGPGTRARGPTAPGSVSLEPLRRPAGGALQGSRQRPFGRPGSG